MNPSEYARMHALEDWYWWYVSRRAAAARFLREYARRDGDRPLQILDAGCGTGGLLDLFCKWPDVVASGLDISAEALKFSRGRGHERLTAGSLTALPFRDNSFDVVTALEVIEHVADDEAAAREIARVLRPGGVIIATVPAYRFLWSSHDEALHHQRRYTGPEFCRLLREAGLAVEKSTHLLAFLFPFAAAARLRCKRPSATQPGGSAGETDGSCRASLLPAVPRPINAALIGLQTVELAISRRLSLPFGLSVLAVARKPAIVPVRVSGSSRAARQKVGREPSPAPLKS